MGKEYALAKKYADTKLIEAKTYADDTIEEAIGTLTAGDILTSDNSDVETKIGAIATTMQSMQSTVDGKLGTSYFNDIVRPTPSPQLLNEAECATGTYYTWYSGAVSTSSVYRESPFIPCTPGATYSKNFNSNVIFWKTNSPGTGNFVSGVQLNNGIKTFTAPTTSTIQYMTFSLSDQDNPATTMVVSGSSMPEVYSAYGATDRLIKGNFIDPTTIEKKRMVTSVQEQYMSDEFVKPFRKVTNPILTLSNVTDRTGMVAVADPFIVQDKGEYHLFFEVLNGTNPLYTAEGPHDEVGHAYSYNLTTWTYDKIVFDYHTFGSRAAYPNVFKDGNTWYMLPDLTGDVVLYEFTDFPGTINPVGTTILTKSTGIDYVDSDIFKIDNVWYLTTSENPNGTGIKLYYNTGDLKTGTWTPHPIGNLIANTASLTKHRCAGNPIVYSDHVIIPVSLTPSSSGVYGEYTSFYKISKLSTTTAVATNLGVVISAKHDMGWMDKSAHHISHADYIHGFIYAVDGQTRSGQYQIGLYVDNYN